MELFVCLMSHRDKLIFFFLIIFNKEGIICNLVVHCLGEQFATCLLLLCLCAVPSLWCLAVIGEASEPRVADELLQEKLNSKE